MKTNERKALFLDPEQWAEEEEEEKEEEETYVQERGKPEVGAGISSVPRSAEEGKLRTMMLITLVVVVVVVV